MEDKNLYTGEALFCISLNNVEGFFIDAHLKEKIHTFLKVPMSRVSKLRMENRAAFFMAEMW